MHNADVQKKRTFECTILSAQSQQLYPYFLIFSVQRMLGTAIPTFIAVITKDKDRSVAMATLQSLNEVLKAVKSLIIDEQGYHDAIAGAVRTVLMHKVC